MLVEPAVVQIIGFFHFTNDWTLFSVGKVKHQGIFQSRKGQICFHITLSHKIKHHQRSSQNATVK